MRAGAWQRASFWLMLARRSSSTISRLRAGFDLAAGACWRIVVPTPAKRPWS